MSGSGRKRAKKTKDPRNPNPLLFPSSREEIVKLLAVLAIASSVALACNYAVVLHNRQPKPFCDTAADDPFSDLCEPCPENAQCSDGKLECLHGYKKQGRKCIEDGEINQTAKKLSDEIQNHVCDAYARASCGEAGKIWFQDEDFEKILHEYKSRDNTGLRDDIFMFVKQKVVGTIESYLEKRAILNGSQEYRCPHMLAELHKPIKCRVRQWVYEHAFGVASVTALFLVLVRFLWSIHQKQKLLTRAEQLYEQICEILEENAMAAKGINNKGEAGVVASWLRDHLLLPSERKDVMLWKKVEELLLEDSRIDQYPKLIRGDSKIVWEWQVDGSLSMKMRAKKAVSKTGLGSSINIFPLHQQSEAKVKVFPIGFSWQGFDEAQHGWSHFRAASYN